ncbi:hypothetical protein F4819DRAFT_461784 [Hypoxylon fuscum]|nr:hypothetical protein F4819DRAFT_461784 [Hypoxylon fuscum]
MRLPPAGQLNNIALGTGYQNLPTMSDDCSRFLQACSDGELDLAKQLQCRVPMESTDLLQSALLTTTKNQHHSIVELLLQCAPTDFTCHFPDPILLNAIDAGPQIYSLFIQKDPSAAQRSFGHMGDALALAVVRNDVTLVRLLLDNGASPAESELFYKPLLALTQELQNVDEEITRMLRETDTKK